MKIKTKKQLNLPQLIEWAAVNDVKVRVFESNPNFDGVTYKLGFNKAGDLYFDEALSPTLLFTVEVEEEITEDTVLPTLIERRDYGNELTYSHYEYVRIKDIKEESGVVFYIENDDLTLDLIWTSVKGLVE